MANRFWVGNGGTWDGSDTTHWSTTSGGAGGASAPTSSDDVFFDANSFTIAFETITSIYTTAVCRNFDMTGLVNCPIGISTGVHGDLTLSPLADYPDSEPNFVFEGSGTMTITSNGASFGGGIDLLGAGTLKLADDFNGTFSAEVNIENGTFDTNNFDFTFHSFAALDTNNVSLIMRGSTWRLLTRDSGGGVSLWLLDESNGNTISVAPGNSKIIIDFATGGPWPGANIAFRHNLTHNIAYNNIEILGDPAGLQGNVHMEFPFANTHNISFNNFTITNVPAVLLYQGHTFTCNNFVSVSPPIIVAGSPVNAGLLADGTSATLSSSHTIVRHLEVSSIVAAGSAVPFEDFPGGIDDGGNTNWCFTYGCHVPSNLYLQNVFMIGSDADGDVQTLNAGKSDDGTPIFYEVQTQELEFGNRLHLKKISDKIVAFTHFGSTSQLQAKTDEGDWQKMPMSLSRRVNIGTDINLEGHFVTFKWFGESSEETPVWEGLYLEDITDLGMTHG